MGVEGNITIMNARKLTLNLFDIFRLGYLRGIDAKTNISELLPILGEPEDIQDMHTLIDKKDGSKIISKSYRYPNIRFGVYNDIIEDIYIIVLGNSRTKGLKLLGYNEFRKITRKKLRNLIRTNGGVITNEFSCFEHYWYIGFKMNEVIVGVTLRRGSKDYIQSFEYSKYR